MRNFIKNVFFNLKMANQKIKAVIFDVDNTLINFLKLKEIAVEEAVSAMIDAGLNKSREEIMKVIDEVYVEKGIEYQNVFDDALKKLMGTVNYKVLAAAITEYRKTKSGHLDTYPKVIPTLIELIKRGYKLGVISDAPKLQLWTRLCDLRLQHFFDVVISSEDVGELKPGSLPFKQALLILGLKPGEVMMVGDNLERDVYGAKKMGMISVLAKYGKVKERIVGMREHKVEHETKPDHEISDFGELLELLP